MPFLRSVTFDCRDPYALAAFWCRVFQVDVSPDDHPEDPEALVDLGRGVTRMLFERVPEPKVAKNRVHVDVQPDTTLEAEVDRLVGLGATVLADHRDEPGGGWMVLADPEGNEFCVERSEAERNALPD